MGEGLWGSTAVANDRRDLLQGLARPCHRDAQLPVLAVPLPGRAPPGAQSPSTGRDTARTLGLHQQGQWPRSGPRHLVGPCYDTSLCRVTAEGRPLSQQSTETLGSALRGDGAAAKLTSQLQVDGLVQSFSEAWQAFKCTAF